MPDQSSSALRWLRDAELACGADVDELLEQVADGHGDQLNAHQSDCLHCQAALGEFTRIWAPVRARAAEPITVPTDDIAREVQYRVITDLKNNVGLTDVTANVTIDDILT